MTDCRRSMGGDDTDLLCVEVSALGAPPTLPRVAFGVWQELPPACTMSSTEQTHEDFLKSLLLKTDVYRPLQASLRYMEDPNFLVMRKAVVDWFAKVSASYEFASETVLAALSHFDRYVSLTLEPVRDNMLLQLAAYVALLVSSKMSETCHLRMTNLESLTGRMFTPLQVKQMEMDMISKLQFRLAPPSADETLHCLCNLLHDSDSWPSSVPIGKVLSAGAWCLRKARARTCWFRHAPFTLALAALATAYSSLGLGQLRRRLLRECDARARSVTGRGVDVKGVVACAEAMALEERAAAAAAVVAAATCGGRGGGCAHSPLCGGGGSSQEDIGKSGWGSPTGVAQGAKLLQEVAFSTVGGGVPLVEEFLPSLPEAFSPCVAAATAPRAVPRAARAPAVGMRGVSAAATAASAAPQAQLLRSTPPRQAGGGRKRGLHQSFGSCFVPCARRPCVDGVVGRCIRMEAVAVAQTEDEERQGGGGPGRSNCNR